MRDTPEDGGDDDWSDSAELGPGRQVPGEAEWEVAAQAHYEPSEADGLTETIVYAIAEAEDVSPTEVTGRPLYDVVDTAALEEAFFSGGTEPNTDEPQSLTEFMFRGFRVLVRSDGWVLVYRRLDAD